MKIFTKALTLALVLGAVTACAVACVGPESDDSGVNENTDTTNTTNTTTAQTTEKAIILRSVSRACSVCPAPS